MKLHASKDQAITYLTSIREVKPAVAKVLDALIAELNSNKLQANEDIALDVIRECVSMGSELPTNSKLEGMSS